jgi:hypothetical protein
MPRMGFEPRIPVFEWAKIFRGLDSTSNMIGTYGKYKKGNGLSVLN